jgi:signal transduction histidine kinase
MKKTINEIIIKIKQKSKSAWHTIVVKPNWQIKLISTFVIVLSILLLVQLLYIIPMLESRDTKAVQENQSTITNNIASELDLHVDEIKDLLSDLVKRPEFKNMDIPAEEAIILEYAEVLPNISSIAVIDIDGTYVCNTASSFVGTKTVTYAKVLPTIENDIYFGPAYYWDFEANYSTHMIVPIKSDDGTKVGYLLGGLYLNAVITKVNTYPMDKGTEVFLVDRNGKVVAQTGVDMFALEGGPLSINYNSYPMVKTALDTTIKWGSSGSREYSYNDTRYFGTYTTLETNGWAVVVYTPMQVITSGSDLLRRNLILINTGIFLIALIITLIFTNQIVKYRKRSENELTKYKNHLEELVSSRTTELTETNQKLAMEIVKNEEASIKIQNLYAEENKLRHSLEDQLTERVELTRALVHELKTPLTPMLVASEILKDKLKDESYKEMVETIYDGANALNKRVGELLDVARGEIGMLKLDCKPYDIHKLIHSTGQYMSCLFTSRRQSFTIEDGDSIPEINLDYQRIGQVLSNLLDNASKYTPKGGKIKLRVFNNQNSVAVEVEDNGLGISSEKQKDLFKPYSTSNSTGQPNNGIGLGLALSKMLIELHGGKIWGGNNINGKGSIFGFSIPC